MSYFQSKRVHRMTKHQSGSEGANGNSNNNGGVLGNGNNHIENNNESHDQMYGN